MRTRSSVAAAILGPILLLSISSAAETPGSVKAGSAEAGAAKAGVCLACHGMNGNSTNPEWPRLAGQQANYIVEQLKHFKDGKRVDPLMSPMAAPLSDQDMTDLGAYYAAQTPAGGEADPSYWKAGEKLYRGGSPDKKIPACMACHGPVGQGAGPARYPALRAQHSVYTVKQLNAYAAGTRPGANAQVMQAIVQRMSAEDIRNVASYIQGMR